MIIYSSTGGGGGGGGGVCTTCSCSDESEEPIRYGNGELRLRETDLEF